MSPPSWWKTYVPGQTTNDVWAPDIHNYNGKVWLYYSISTFGKNTSVANCAMLSPVTTVVNTQNNYFTDGTIAPVRRG